jgi:hypothetical protein
MTRTSEAQALAEETLRQLELGEGRLTPIVLKSLRLARLLDQRAAEDWFRLELRGYRQDVPFCDSTTWAQSAIWSGRQSAKGSQGEQLYWLAPIEEIESELEIAREDLQALQLLPTSLAETGSEQRSYFLQTPAEKILNTILLKRQEKARLISRWSRVVACLRGAMQEWLVRVVVQLRYGAAVESAFHRAKERFDNFLSVRAPDVARRLAAAYERAYSADPEEWSQALTSCRRALKTLADSVYAPTEAEPFGYPLTDEHYRNRLIQFASERLTSQSQSDLIAAEINLVVQRVEALDGLANKGVHSDVDERDLELTLVHTYLLAGELLALLPVPEPKPQLEPVAVDDQAAADGLLVEASVVEPEELAPPPSES